jgi:hypothetical protein
MIERRSKHVIDENPMNVVQTKFKALYCQSTFETLWFYSNDRPKLVNLTKDTLKNQNDHLDRIDPFKVQKVILN